MVLLRASDVLVGIIAGAVCSVIAALFEASILLHLRDAQLTPLRRSAALLCGSLARPALLRLALGVVGGIVLPACLITFGPLLSPAVSLAGSTLAFLALLGGEVAERYLFFAAVVAPKMPGGVLS